MTTTTSPATDATGYAQASSRPSALRAARNNPLVTGVLVLLAVAVTLLVVGHSPEDATPLSPHNPGPDGARAAAEILGDQGVDVRYVSTLAAASASSPETTTLVIARPDILSREQAEAVMAYPGDIVFLGASRAVSQLAGLGTDNGGDYVPTTTVVAGCDDPDAVAAEDVTVSTGAITGATGADVTACFTTDEGASGYVVAHDDNRTVRVIGSSNLTTNSQLANDGNAALTLRALGHHPSIVWYVADLYDVSLPSWAEPNGDTPGDLTASTEALPPWFMPVVFVAFLTVLMAGWWRGRRFGPLVPEPLPVVVPGAEAVRGRARLYRKSGDVPHASAALRAHAATRIGRRLGVPASATPDALIDATHRATGRRREDVARLLAGPLPTTTTDMMTLIKELDSLESEVHRP